MRSQNRERTKKKRKEKKWLKLPDSVVILLFSFVLLRMFFFHATRKKLKRSDSNSFVIRQWIKKLPIAIFCLFCDCKGNQCYARGISRKTDGQLLGKGFFLNSIWTKLQGCTFVFRCCAEKKDVHNELMRTSFDKSILISFVWVILFRGPCFGGL